MHRPGLAADLERWLDGFPIQARPVSKVERAIRWCRRRPALASILAVFALTVTSSLVGLLTLWRHSETERSRAENALGRAIASDKATTGAVRDLVSLLTRTMEAPQMLAHQRVVESSRVIRDLTAKLRQNPGADTSNVVATCGLEAALARDFSYGGRYSESRALLMDAIDLLEEHGKGALAPEAAQTYVLCLVNLGAVARDQQRYDEALVWLERAEKALETFGRDPQDLQVILSLDEVRRTTAALYGLRGQDELRRKLLESHVSMLERLSERDGSDPTIALLAAGARVLAGTDKNATAMFRAAMETFPADRRLPNGLKQALAYWISRNVQSYPFDPVPTGDPRARPDPDVHAHAVIRAIESECRALGVYPALFPAAALRVCGVAVARGAEQRKAGRLDDARWTASSLFAFGQVLARRAPDDAAFHVVLSEAFDQEAKNAWKVNDFPRIEAATRKALVAAWTAISLDPSNASARIKVMGLQDKMARLTSGRAPLQ